MCTRHACALIIAVLFLNPSGEAVAQDATACPADQGVALQILGSGGPIADDARASASYIVWVDGKARVMIDVGGGSFVRFGEAGARFADLGFIGLSHFHTDHSADFPTLLKTGLFSPSGGILTLAGPDAGGPFPGLGVYLDALLHPETGAYGYLSGYRDGRGGLPKIEAYEVEAANPEITVVYDSPADDISVAALGVPHGIVPALGFRVRVSDVELVFASDQNGTDRRFVEFASGAEVLVMHMPIPEGTTDSAIQLHAVPGILGRIATEAKVETLVLSHFMARSLKNLDENVAVVRNGYAGRIIVADDLDCLIVN